MLLFCANYSKALSIRLHICIWDVKVPVDVCAFLRKNSRKLDLAKSFVNSIHSFFFASFLIFKWCWKSASCRNQQGLKIHQRFISLEKNPGSTFRFRNDGSLSLPLTIRKRIPKSWGRTKKNWSEIFPSHFPWKCWTCLRRMNRLSWWVFTSTCHIKS